MNSQYLEDLATAYWFSEALFTALEMDLFTILEREGTSAGELAGVLAVDSKGLERFLHALSAMGLLSTEGSRYYNTSLASTYLVQGRDSYQGDSILWRKELCAGWRNLAKCIKAGGRVDFAPCDEDENTRAVRTRQYITAMDRVARTKVQELLPFFEGVTLKGRLLDVGAGSGAISAGFLEQFPALDATLLDLPGVLNLTREFMTDRGLTTRCTFFSGNILEVWQVDKEQYDLIILSNIVHAYSEEEISHILGEAAKCLKPEGIMVIHDFFLEHCPAKAGLFDLNMFINTYNGKLFSQQWIRDQLTSLKLCTSKLVPLPSDTALIFASKSQTSLSVLGSVMK